LNEVPHTLLLTATVPGPEGVGGIILSDLCDFLPRERLCVAFAQEGRPRPDPIVSKSLRLKSFPIAFRRRPDSRFGRIGRIVSALPQAWRNRREVTREIEACICWAREQGVQQVWAVLDSPLTHEMAAGVAKGLGVPLRTTVWDDVHHNNRYFGLDRLTARRSLRGFVEALRDSRSIAVIGESMQEEYRRLYGVASVVVRHGVAPDTAKAMAVEPIPGAALRIGFAGSVSARSAFDLFLETLDRMDWRIDGRPVSLRLLGPRFDLRSSVPRRIECLGWRSVEESIRLLGECEINYLPQPFERDLEPFTRLSFPSKLTTYLAAGRPLVLHAPPEASLVPFNQRHGFAVGCEALDSGILEASLRCAADPGIGARCVAAAREVLSAEFSRERFRADFARFLDVRGEALRT
jgi:glycosyltransferase involved in cell wall biosynthesis